MARTMARKDILIHPDPHLKKVCAPVAAIDDSVTIEKNGTFKAKAAALVIDPEDGVLTIEKDAKLEISNETSTPSSTRRYDEHTPSP